MKDCPRLPRRNTLRGRQQLSRYRAGLSKRRITARQQRGRRCTTPTAPTAAPTDSPTDRRHHTHRDHPRTIRWARRRCSQTSIGQPQSSPRTRSQYPTPPRFSYHSFSHHRHTRFPAEDFPQLRLLPVIPELLTPRPSQKHHAGKSAPIMPETFFHRPIKKPPKTLANCRNGTAFEKNEVNDTLPSAKRTVHKLRSAEPTRPPCRPRSQIPRPVPPGPADTSDSSVATVASLNNILRLQYKYELSLQTVCRASSVNA